MLSTCAAYAASQKTLFCQVHLAVRACRRFSLGLVVVKQFDTDESCPVFHLLNRCMLDNFFKDTSKNMLKEMILFIC